jgi:hypothetical protein
VHGEDSMYLKIGLPLQFVRTPFRNTALPVWISLHAE